MRLHRVAVESFRGIAAQEVAFAETGVTVVEAPNEAGKTSLLEAVTLVLDYKDSSRAQPVREVQPVGRDVGSLVEVELSCGQYRLTCRKRFNRQPLTELAITAPQPEQLAGDEAHQRLQRILDAHLDRALFDALWFEQGRSLGQLAVGDSWSLGAALDQAAGGGADPATDDLFDAVVGEHNQWFTPKAQQPRQELKALDARVGELDSQAASLRQRLNELQDDVDRSATLDRELAELAQRREALLPDLEHSRQQLADIQQLRSAVDEQTKNEELARARRDHAQGELDRRGELERAIGELEQWRAGLEADLTRCDDEVARLEGQHRRLTAVRDDADAAAQQARRTATARRADVELVEAATRLERHRDAHHKVAEADAAAHDAEVLLAGCALTDERLAAIDAAHEDLRLAEAQLEAGAPAVTVEALGDVTVGVDGEPATLAVGEQHTVSVADPTELDIGDVARIAVRPGASLAQLTEARRTARAALDKACAAAGVADRDEAHRVAIQRRDAESTVAARDQRLAELLGGHTRESLAGEIQQLATWVEGQSAARAADEALPATVDQAQARSREADAAVEEADRAAEQARAAVAELEPSLSAAREDRIACQTKRDSADEQLAARRDELQRARCEQPDDALVVERDEHERQRRAAEQARQQAQAQLDEAHPEQVELLADNLERQLGDVDAQREELDAERTEVRARLRAHGEQGLGERLAQVEAELERARVDRDRQWRHANAAKLLFDVMAQERTRAQQAYRQPLTQAIERLGRLVHDDSFAVELDDGLAVARRTLQGQTVAWNQLSGGAKEQLGVLSALACGSLIDDGGAPLILDDALGYTDPARLERMGAVLAAAARDCQVIVLTCVADRYGHVGGAAMRRLSARSHATPAATSAHQPHPDAASETSPSPPAETPSAETPPAETSLPAEPPAAAKPKATGRSRCRLCHQPGHNRRTCPQRASDGPAS